MSRIGKIPIALPEKVDVKTTKDEITVKGPKGTLTNKYNNRCIIKITDDQVIIERPTDNKKR